MADSDTSEDRDPGTDSDPGAEQQQPNPPVNLFTISALRLHHTRLPPTPGTEPSLLQRLKRWMGRALRKG